jgi:hypothetical protein
MPAATMRLERRSTGPSWSPVTAAATRTPKSGVVSEQMASALARYTLYRYELTMKLNPAMTTP